MARRVLTLGLLLGVTLSTQVMAQTQQPMTSGVVPVVAHLKGANNSFWTTDVYLTQTDGGAAAVVKLTILNPGGAPWSTQITLPAARGAAQVSDVVRAVSASIPQGKYVMTWESTQPLIVSTRTLTTEGTKTYGQGTASLAPGSGFQANGRVILPAPLDAGSFRVNVGLANAGAATQGFVVDSVDAAGGVLASYNQSVPAGAVIQLRTNNTGNGAGSVAVRCTTGCDGTAFSYMTVVVNSTNDAYFVYGAATADTSQVLPVQTFRDSQGAWFITGGTLYDVFESMGYSVATDRLWQAELYRRQARGTLSEIFGSSQLSTDVLMRTLGYSEQELQAAYDALDLDTRTVLTGYADGFNRRIAEVTQDPSKLPFEFWALSSVLHTQFVPAPWKVTDLLCWLAALQHNFDGEGSGTGELDNAVLLQTLASSFPADAINMFNDLRWLDDPQAVTYIPRSSPSPAAGASGVAALPSIAATASKLPDLRDAASRIDGRFSQAVDNLKRINAYVKLGSYGWVVSGKKTASGHPIIYSGPQMGNSYAPSIVTEGSIVGGGLVISGMTVPGIAGIIIGRTPHHAWAMQTGHAHTVDFYLDPPSAATLNRVETIKVAGGSPVTLPIYRTPHGPIVDPMPFDPNPASGYLVSWKYSQWGTELADLKAFLDLTRVQSVDGFAQAIEKFACSFHFEYADRDGNIAYWLSGFDPVRAAGSDPRLPLRGDGTQEWPQPVTLKARSTDRNNAQGFYGGWNNKSNPTYAEGFNWNNWAFGMAHRAQVVDDYLLAHDNLTFEQVRDLALSVATTDFKALGGGVAWKFFAPYFTAAVQAHPTDARTAALAMMQAWDQHFVAGGASEWPAGTLRADAWVLEGEWINQLVTLVFADELGASVAADPHLVNVLLHALAGSSSGVVNTYDWFQDRSGSGKPTDPQQLIVLALDNALAKLGTQPWNVARGEIVMSHTLLGTVHTAPYSDRSTYAHCIEYGPSGPVRIESMFPLGESGDIRINGQGKPVFDANFFSMSPFYDAFAPRPFPLFP
jgi:penicillin G amidase